MIVYGIPTCDTCRKALKDISAAGRVAQLRDIRKQPLSDAEVSRLVTAFGDAIVNRSSATWRGLGDGAREKSTADLILAHPTVMKRPVIEDGDALHLGWREETRAAVLK